MSETTSASYPTKRLGLAAEHIEKLERQHRQVVAALRSRLERGHATLFSVPPARWP